MKYMLVKQLCFTAILWICIAQQSQAQDTIRLKLADAETILSNRNLSLLAEKYNIDIAKANIIQAKLYTNPNISFSAAAYNPVNHKIFDVGNNGEYSIALQQLIRLAGKRNKEIKMAETATTSGENKFYDLWRTLQYSLHSSFYEMYFLQQSVTGFQTQITSVEKLNKAYESLAEKNIVTVKDALRIKSLLYSLKSDQAGIESRINELEADMQILLQSNNVFYVAEITNTDDISKKIKGLNLQHLVDTAYINRNDLKLSQNNMLLNQQNYAYQKALAVPDITAGAGFDKQGSYISNASFLTLAIDLPFFNRNQGNIKAAKISIDQGRVQYEQQQQQVSNDVYRAFVKLLNTDKLLQSIDPTFQTQYEKMLQGITDNFEKKNISLIEFTDFYDSYKNNMLQYNQLQNDRMQAVAALSFSIGKPLFNN